jgi:hypothetical protein
MLRKNLNEKDNFSRSTISLNSIVKLEKKLKQLEHCQNLQNSLLLNKIVKEKSSLSTNSNKDNEIANYDIFSSSDYSHIDNDNDSLADSQSTKSKSRKNGKWTKEEVNY